MDEMLTNLSTSIEQEARARQQTDLLVARVLVLILADLEAQLRALPPVDLLPIFDPKHAFSEAT